MAELHKVEVAAAWEQEIIRANQVWVLVIREHFVSKADAELAFWRSRLEIDQGRFRNAYYERLMLGMAGETNADFLADKVVADFGCGPRGSLVWASPARLRIGIDVLADRYADEFTSNLVSHGMIYLKSTERVIPLPSDFLDVMFTLNAIDHVDHLGSMCGEILRVIKPGGLFIGSFNLEEPPSPTEPQRLTESSIKENLLNSLEVESYRVTAAEPPHIAADHVERSRYEPFFEGNLSYTPGEQGYLWVRAMKPRVAPYG
jgi:SAM-dependent methyltransferase